MLFKHSKINNFKIFKNFIKNKNKLKTVEILNNYDNIDKYSFDLYPIKLEDRVIDRQTISFNNFFVNDFIINDTQYLNIGAIHGNRKIGNMIINILENYKPDNIIMEWSKFRFDELKNEFKTYPNYYKNLYDNIKSNNKIFINKNRLLEINLAYEYSLRNNNLIYPSDLCDFEIKNNLFSFRNCNCLKKIKNLKSKINIFKIINQFFKDKFEKNLNFDDEILSYYIYFNFIEIYNLKNKIKCINNDIHLEREFNFFYNSIKHPNGQKVVLITGMRHYLYLNTFFNIYKKTNSIDAVKDYIFNLKYCNN